MRQFKPLDMLIEDLTLDMFRTGSDKINYQILKMLPTDIPSVMERINLTKVPVNVRVNSLVDVDLIERKKGTGKIIATKTTQIFIGYLDNMQDIINKQLEEK